jgi:hypothetical protein
MWRYDGAKTAVAREAAAKVEANVVSGRGGGGGGSGGRDGKIERGNGGNFSASAAAASAAAVEHGAGASC